MKIKVPWARPYIGNEEWQAVKRCFESGWLSMGALVEKFEKKTASYIGVKQAIAVNSGTAALDVALKVLGIGSNDEVIVPAMAYIATANAVLYQNAVPVFADIDSRTFNIDPIDVRRKITRRTKCIIAIDYAGQAANFENLKKIAKEYNLFLVEDGAPSLGGVYNGKKLCSFGDISITSFHIAKIFTTIEGGMLFTDKDEYAKKAKIIRSQGEDPDKKYHHPVLGHNFRMTDLNAAIGLAQTSRMKDVLLSRKKTAEYYISKLMDNRCIITPYVAPGSTHAWFLFPILISNRDKVKAYLAEKGISTNVSWPIPIYDQKIYRPFKKEICPVAEKITKEILCLPMFYRITKKEQDYIIKHLLTAVVGD